MPVEVHNIFFNATSGGVDGENALTDDIQEFGVDAIIKDQQNELILSDTGGGSILSDYKIVMGLIIMVKNAYLYNTGVIGGTATTDFSLFQQSVAGYTDPITIQSPSPPNLLLEVGGANNIWGVGNSWTTNDINNIRIKINNPNENNSNLIAIKGTFIFLKVYYMTKGKIILTNGKISMSRGKLKI
jgi:hypothetical protein